MFMGSGLKTGLLIISGYFYALILGPALYGVWQTARIFMSYGSFINLGMPFIVQRDFARLKAEGRGEEAERMGQLVISYSFLSFPFVGLFIFLLAFIFGGDILFRHSLIAVAIWFLLTIPAGIGTIMNKAVNDYDTISKAEAFYGIGNLLIVPFIYWHGFYALLFGYILLTLTLSVFYYRHKPIKYRWYWNSRLVKQLIFSAFPIFLVHVTLAIFASIDRLIIASMLDFKHVGLYSLSTFIASPIKLVVSSFSVVLFTHLNEHYGSSTEKHVIQKHVFTPQRVFSNILPPLIGFGLIALPFLTELFLPRYKNGIIAAQINIFAIFFYMLAGFSANALFVMNKQLYSALSFLLAGIIKTAGSYFGIKRGFGIESVAFFSVVGYFIYDNLMLYFVNKNLGYRFRDYLKYLFAKSYCPAILFLFLGLYLVYRDRIFLLMHLNNPWLQLFVSEMLLILVSFSFVRTSVKTIRAILNKEDI